MKASVFVGISVDGFMARKNGGIDFLPADCEPHGFEEFYASVDAVVIGRKTFEWVVDYGGWAYGEKMRVVVLSSKPLDLSVARARGGKAGADRDQARSRGDHAPPDLERDSRHRSKGQKAIAISPSLAKRAAFSSRRHPVDGSCHRK